MAEKTNISPDYEQLYVRTAAELEKYKKQYEEAAAEAGRLMNDLKTAKDEARWLKNELDLAEAKLEIVYLVFGGVEE